MNQVGLFSINNKMRVTLISFILVISGAVLINLGFLLSFLVRYGLPFPELNFQPYRKVSQA